MIKRSVYDQLIFKRSTEDGGQYYIGNKGTYLLLFNLDGTESDRIGKAILNRKYLTALFKSKFKTEFVGDVRNEKKFLIFKQTGHNKITIFWIPKRK